MSDTKTKQVMTTLNRGKTITSMEAWQLYNVTRLADIVYKKRKAGYDIRDVSTKKQNYSVYKLFPKEGE